MAIKRVLAVLLMCISAVSQTPNARTAIVAGFVPNPGTRLYNEFRQYVLPHVDAVMVRIDWNDIETTPGKYDFSALDAALAVWPKNVLLVSLVSDAVVGHGKNTATPVWVLAKTKIATCPFNRWGIPVAYDPPYVAAVKAFMSALFKHLDGNPKLLYLRTGIVGGENTPTCGPQWPGFTEAKFLALIKDMADFATSLHSKLLFVNNANGSHGNSYADAEAAIFHADKIGIGMQDLAATDAAAYKAGKPCYDNWCAWAKKYPADFRYLQVRQNQPPAALPVYVPFAKGFGINALELNSSDLLTAYDPNDSAYTQWGKAYRDAIEK